METRSYNRDAWDREVARGNRWTRPVASAVIERARRGEWSVVLTNTKPVPRDWFPPLAGADVLCLASGGGQQGPVLSAAGARVTILDNSPAQLTQDRTVAEREGLDLTLVEGDMADLSAFADASFDLVFHPISNCFAEEVRPVWRECHRVLRPGGTLLAGFINPVYQLFDRELEDQCVFTLKYAQPFSSAGSLTAAELERLRTKGEPLEFGHSLTDQLGGQLDAGLRLVALYEDGCGNDEPIDRHMSAFLATRAVKPPA